jgi:ParB family chromosome partitioning protein
MPISEIILLPRKRASKEIEPLIRSIMEIGLMNPITINKRKILVSGYHRLQACKAMGWVEVPVIIMDYDNLHSEMAEIDENIIKNEMTALENAEQLKRRKDIYEIIHPDNASTRARQAQIQRFIPSNHNDSIVKSETFLKNTVKETGKSKCTINRYLEIGTNIPKAVIAMLKGTSVEDNFVELLALSKISPPDKQKELVDKFLSGEFKTIRAAIKFQKEQNMPKHVNTKKTTIPVSAYRKILKDFVEAEQEISLLKMENLKLTKELEEYKQKYSETDAA